MSLLFANDDDPMAKKNAPEGPKPVNGADIRPTGNKTAATRNIGALTGLPSTYADKVPESETSVNGLDVSKVGQKNAGGNDIHADAKNDERGKTNSASTAKNTQSAAQKNTSGSSNVTPPPMPGAPPMPGSNGNTSASAPIIRREASKQEQAEIRAKEQATASAISFGISNGGVK